VRDGTRQVGVQAVDMTSQLGDTEAVEDGQVERSDLLAAAESIRKVLQCTTDLSPPGELGADREATRRNDLLRERLELVSVVLKAMGRGSPP
jgi:hypothetical protein